MYTPKAFQIDNDEDALRLVDAHSFATLVGLVDGKLEATHLPLLLCPKETKTPILIGHLAAGNPLLKVREILAIFQGEDGYISPNYYPSKQRDNKVVPTWNYEAVHIYGSLTLARDETETVSIMHRLTNHFEAHSERPWSVDDMPSEYLAKQLKGIVAFKISVEKIEGKRKLSQNKSEEDLLGAISGVQSRGGEANRALAEAMVNARNNRPRKD